MNDEQLYIFQYPHGHTIETFVYTREAALREGTRAFNLSPEETERALHEAEEWGQYVDGDGFVVSCAQVIR